MLLVLCRKYKATLFSTKIGVSGSYADALLIAPGWNLSFERNCEFVLWRLSQTFALTIRMTILTLSLPVAQWSLHAATGKINVKHLSDEDCLG